METEQVAGAGLGVADGLDVAHAEGITHPIAITCFVGNGRQHPPVRLVFVLKNLFVPLNVVGT